MAKRGETHSKVAELLGVDPAQLEKPVPVGVLNGPAADPFKWVTPDGFDAKSGVFARAVDERQAVELEGKGYVRVNNPDIRMQGFAPGSGINMFRPAHIEAEAQKQREQRDKARHAQKRRTQTSLGGLDATATVTTRTTQWTPPG